MRRVHNVTEMRESGASSNENIDDCNRLLSEGLCKIRRGGSMPLIGISKRTVKWKTYIANDDLNTMKLGKMS